MPENLYLYKILQVVSIYDGDTLTVEIDLGMNISRTETIRLYGIDTPELRGTSRNSGLESRDYLRSIINSAEEEHLDIYIRTYKDKGDKYGRLLGEIFLGDLSESINDKLVSSGYAIYREY